MALRVAEMNMNASNHVLMRAGVPDRITQLREYVSKAFFVAVQPGVSIRNMPGVTVHPASSALPALDSRRSCMSVLCPSFGLIDL